MAFVVNIERTQHEFQRISLVLVFDFQLVYTCCGKRKLSCNYTELVLKKNMRRKRVKGRYRLQLAGLLQSKLICRYFQNFKRIYLSKTHE